MNIPYHTHNFELPVAKKEDIAAGISEDKVVVPAALGTAAIADIHQFATAEQGKLASTAVQAHRKIILEEGLFGGGDLSQDVHIALSADAKENLQKVRTAVQQERKILAKEGLQGGGSLERDVILSLSGPTQQALAQAQTAVQPSRKINAGAGLIGGGDLKDDRTLALEEDLLHKIAASVPSSALKSLAYKDKIAVSDIEAHGPRQEDHFLCATGQWRPLPAAKMSLEAQGHLPLEPRSLGLNLEKFSLLPEQDTHSMGTPIAVLLSLKDPYKHYYQALDPQAFCCMVTTESGKRVDGIELAQSFAFQKRYAEKKTTFIGYILLKKSGSYSLTLGYQGCAFPGLSPLSFVVRAPQKALTIAQAQGLDFSLSGASLLADGQDRIGLELTQDPAHPFFPFSPEEVVFLCEETPLGKEQKQAKLCAPLTIESCAIAPGKMRFSCSYKQAGRFTIIPSVQGVSLGKRAARSLVVLDPKEVQAHFITEQNTLYANIGQEAELSLILKEIPCSLQELRDTLRLVVKDQKTGFVNTNSCAKIENISSEGENSYRCCARLKILDPGQYWIFPTLKKLWAPCLPVALTVVPDSAGSLTDSSLMRGRLALENAERGSVFVPGQVVKYTITLQEEPSAQACNRSQRIEVFLTDRFGQELDASCGVVCSQLEWDKAHPLTYYGSFSCLAPGFYQLGFRFAGQSTKPLMQPVFITGS